MTRKCFYSFYYQEDSWRVSQVKGIGTVEGQPIVSGNKWEEVERGGDAAIQNWIDENLKGRSCLIVLVGSNTAGRRWVNYEIKKAWEDGKGVLGVRIHNLQDANQRQSLAGADPFATWTVGSSPMSNWAKTYNPPYSNSQQVYAYISNNLEAWVEEAIDLRGRA